MALNEMPSPASDGSAKTWDLYYVRHGWIYGNHRTFERLVDLIAVLPGLEDDPQLEINVRRLAMTPNEKLTDGGHKTL